MTATLKTGIVQEPSSSIANLTLSSSGGVTFGAAATTNTITSAAATALTLQSAGTTAITVDTSQNVGIGTTSPISKLHVSAADGQPLTVNGATKAIRIITNSSYAAVQAVDNTGVTSYQPLLLSGSILEFGISGSEVARIDSSGNLLVGATTYSGSGLSLSSPNGSGCYSIFAAAGTGNHWRFGNVTNGVVGSIQSTTTTTLFNTSSDYRLKENVTPMTTGLATIAALKPINYDWISDKSAGEGFIAHELQVVIPLAVSGAKDAVDADGKPEYQGVDYSKIVVHLVAAIQELKAEFDAYKAAHP